MLSKLATQSFNILRLIARNPNFLRPKVPYFNVSRLSRLQMAQKWPKMTQNGPKWPKYDPKWPKMALEWPKMIQSGPKMTQNGPQLPQMAQKWRPDLRTFCEPISLSLERALSSEIGSQDPCSAHHAVVAWEHFMLLWAWGGLKTQRSRSCDRFQGDFHLLYLHLVGVAWEGHRVAKLNWLRLYVAGHWW